MHKRNNAIITFFLKFMSIFLKFTYSTSHSCALTYGPLSSVFLANYMPKCQMSSGPYGPIFYTSFRALTQKDRLIIFYCFVFLFCRSITEYIMTFCVTLIEHLRSFIFVVGSILQKYGYVSTKRPIRMSGCIQTLNA